MFKTLIMFILFSFCLPVLATGGGCRGNCGPPDSDASAQEQSQEQAQQQRAEAKAKSKSKARSKSRSKSRSRSHSGDSTATGGTSVASSTSGDSSATSTSGDSSATGGAGGASSSNSQTGDNSVTIEGSTSSYKYIEAANSAAIAMGGQCTDGTTGQGRRFGFGISRANPVCEQLMMYRIFLARGETERADNALSNAEDLADIRSFGRGFLTVISLGIL